LSYELSILPAHTSPYLLLAPSALDEFKALPSRPPAECDAVVIGLHPPGFGYENLNTAFRILKQEPLAHTEQQEDVTAASTPAVSRRPSPTPEGKKPVLIAPHRAAYTQTNATAAFPAGLSLGIGPYIAALEYASGVKAEVVGKPTRAFFELALARLREKGGWEGEDGEVAIVGDDVDNDLGGGARELGLQRILGELGREGQLKRGEKGGMEGNGRRDS
jgi:ribonucleotide monophosphatase NagD (HAD superfamily)